MNLPDAPFGGGIVYQGYDNGTVTLMYSDGTPAGTRPFPPAGTPAVAMTNYPFAFAGSIIFVASDPQAGPVLWRSDGTSAGTRYLTDIDPSADGSAPPADFLANNGKMFFAGTHSGMGRELWALSSVDPNASDDVLRTANATVGVAAILANDADFDGMLNPSSVEIVTPPASGTATIDNITGAITYTPGAGFSGTDVLAYRVADNNGRFSNSAYLSIVVASPAGAGAGTAPAPTPVPPPTPVPVPSSNPPSSGGGGGGALGVDLLLMALLLIPRVRRLQRVTTR